MTNYETFTYHWNRRSETRGLQSSSSNLLFMRLSAAVGALVLSLSISKCSEPYHVDVRQDASAEATDSIDHLEPVDRLVPQFYYIAQFIKLPSFEKGTYLAVFKTEHGYLLQLASLPVGDRAMSRPTPETEVQIPESLAQIVYELWINALLEVRYDRKSFGEADGTDYIFSSFLRGKGWMHGKIWSPIADRPPKWLIDSAHELVSFAQDPHRDATKTEVILRRNRDKLFEYVEKHGKH